MDILVITWNYPPRRGGIESLLKNLCHGLRQKHRVSVVTSFDHAATSVEPGTFRAALPGLIPFAIYALWRGAIILARYPQIHVVFGGSALVTPLVVLLARLFRRRAIVLTHGLDVVHRNFLYQLLCVHWLKFCDRVIANSRYTAALAVSKSVTQERLTVIPPGVQPERFSLPTDIVAIKRRWNIEGKKVILFVGRLARRKGIKEFIESSLVGIVREIPEAVLLIVGDNPSESLAHHGDVVSEIKTTVAKMGLEKHVGLLGSLGDDEVIELYRACDLVILPAVNITPDAEGFGMVLLEAAAAGKPVVATRVGGISEAIADGESGVLVAPGDYAQLTRAVVSLLSDNQARRAMGERAARRARDTFSWSTIVEAYEQALNSGQGRQRSGERGPTARGR